ncbi:hypothetical protein Tco_0378364, partial [Tanacetum coccineum]
DFTIANVPVTTVGVEISTASPEVKTTGDSVDDIAAKSLVYIRRSATKSKDKGSYTLQQLRGYSFDEIKSLFEETMKKVNTFTPMESEVERIVLKIATGSTKRAVEEELELKRLFEPDADDELWKSQKHIHDITWRLYDICGVHHVSTKDGVDIYMLVEREYPLSRGVLIQMLVAKLLVEQDNEMSRELLNDKDKDQDPSAGSDRGTKRSKSSKEAESSKDPRSKESKSSSSSNALNKGDWFKKPERALTPDPNWDKSKHIDFRPPQTWISDTARAKKPPTSFDELTDTPIDFSAFVMNRLNITNLTQEILVGPAFNLHKGTCKSRTKLRTLKMSQRTTRTT